MDSNQVQAGLEIILGASSKKKGNNSEFPVKWVYAIFQKFSNRYLTKWTSSIEGVEEDAAKEWATFLRGITGEQIKKGLEEWSGDWPPSAPEFRKCCLGIKKNEHGLNYVPEIYRAETKIFTAKNSKWILKTIRSD